MPLIRDSRNEDSSLEPIAIVGMACRLPGEVGSASDLWDLLVRKGSGQTPKVPKNRFNIDAHYHENLERPGSFNVLGGYFLDGNLEDFDPTFFGMTPIEAMWLDPQQRKMLEVTYECIESAGLTLEDVSDTNTAVYVGSFTADYQQMSTKDPDFRHNYAATGVDPGIISNRIGNTFNLKGPSFTINTACSSSVYAIHNACYALRARDCEAAITGGVNLILTVDQHMNTAKLGILSPTSTCHTFDASADGYGRAEGAGALYLKRLSDAIRDDDIIRGVIRSSAVNTNGKVPGMGITHPSVKGQELVVRKAYERANLDPVKTAYLEMHGTGTPVGDPIEARAVSNAMNDTRSKANPLLVGAIKANIGHSEAASGIFAVMKAAMMTEAAVIPGVAGFKALNPSIKESEWNIKVNANTAPWPQESSIRRASVSSFGYGGTNGHVIVESVESLYPFYSHGQARDQSNYDNSTHRPLLVGFSAHDKTTLQRNVDAHARVADKFYLADLAHTLNARRTRFSHRAYAISREGHEAEDFAMPQLTTGTAPSKVPDLAFIFTGQGAQWAGVGLEAMDAFPSFSETLRRLDRVLSRLEDPPAWTFEGILRAKPELSSINEPDIAQPVCTAVQIAITDLLARWDITPVVTMGHSSGEIGAAYAAGLHSAPEAILAAFCRGLAVKNHSPSGAMMAVGMGAADVSEYLEGLGGDIVIACENSPQSVTLSGTFEAIEVAKRRFDTKKVFAHELRTGKAYHSPQMASVAPFYDALLSRACEGFEATDLEWRQPRARMISSVTGSEIHGEEIPLAYWSANLRNRVLFDTAVTAFAKDPAFAQATSIVEIGPHSALAGPFKQIRMAAGLEGLTYTPTLVRNADSAVQLLRTAGELFIQDYPLNLDEVNALEEVSDRASSKKRRSPRALVDLPAYQWNYEKRYWTEPQPSEEQRALTHMRHDLLGSKISGLSERSIVWKNTLRHRDVPWLKDHSLGGSAVFPAAGHMSLAIEALRQVCENKDLDFAGVTLRDVKIQTALIVPDADNGIEVQLRFQETTNSKGSPRWYSFSVESRNEGQWTVHCEGTICAMSNKESSVRDDARSPVKKEELNQRVPAQRWYDAFHRVGFQYERTFTALKNGIRTNAKVRHAAGDVHISQDSGVMTGESRYILHPATIDACLQLIIISINSGLHKEMPWGVVPIGIEEVKLWFPEGEESCTGPAVAWTDECDGRYFNTHTKLHTARGNLVMDIHSLRCVAYEAAVPQTTTAAIERAPYSEMAWKPDITALSDQASFERASKDAIELDAAGKIVELLHHKDALKSILIVGPLSGHELASIIAVIAPFTKVTIGCQSLELAEGLKTTGIGESISTMIVPAHAAEWDQVEVEEFGLILVKKSVASVNPPEQLVKGAELLASKNAYLLFSTASTDADSCYNSVTASPDLLQKLRLDLPNTSYVLAQKAAYMNGVHAAKTDISLVSDNVASTQELENQLTLQGCDVTATPPSKWSPIKGKVTLVYDADGALFSSLTQKLFDRVKALLLSGSPVVWVTSGVNDGKTLYGSMSQGFLRAIRSEEASAKLLLLDVSPQETMSAIAAAIVGKLGKISTKDSGVDTEYWLNNGVLRIPRIVENEPLNQQFTNSDTPAKSITLSEDQSLEGKVSNGKLVFEPVESFAPIRDTEVEVQVHYSEFDKKDLQPHDGMPRLVAGRITKIGGEVDAGLEGQECVAFSDASFTSAIRVPATACVIGETSADLVATLPVLCQAVNALLFTAKVQPKEHVILLPASKHIVEVFIALATLLKFKLTIVSASEKATGELAIQDIILDSTTLVSANDHSAISATLEQGASVVIAHDYSSLTQEVWRHAPAFSRFVLNDATLDSAVDMLPFSRGASLTATGISSLYKSKPDVLATVLQRSVAVAHAYPSGLSGGLREIDVGDLANEEGLTSAMTVSQPSVLTYKYGQSMVTVQPKAKTMRFSPDAAYLLVGCLGGLGRSLTTWMIDQGCKHFAFLSRSGADKTEASHVVKTLKQAGANVQVIRGDASNINDVRDAVAQVTAGWPIKGVVHAAMVLKDGIFSRMTYDNYQACVAPKVDGALNLHEALKDVPLDFFVMTSSISTVLGNPGQANYSAANSFLDALAWYRNRNGLAASSIALPMVLDVGVVAENDDIETSLSRKGMYGIDEREMLRGFATAMLQPVPDATATPAPRLGDAQIILGLEPAALAEATAGKDAADIFWYHDARLNGVRAAVQQAQAQSSQKTGGAGGDFAGVLRAATALGREAAVQAIALHVMQRCSSILLTPVEDMEFDGRSVAAYGLDSMIGAELRNWLFKEFGLDIDFQRLLAPTLTFKVLAETVADTLGIE